MFQWVDLVEAVLQYVLQHVVWWLVVPEGLPRPRYMKQKLVDHSVTLAQDHGHVQKLQGGFVILFYPKEIGMCLKMYLVL